MNVEKWLEGSRTCGEFEVKVGTKTITIVARIVPGMSIPLRTIYGHTQGNTKKDKRHKYQENIFFPRQQERHT